MWIFAALSLWTFQEVNGVAGGLMVPVLIWITVVVYINWYIWRHNHKEVFSN